MAWAHALRAALAKHPHLLAVPITESAGHDAGRLAAGYFLLLEHVENQSPAFIRTAVDRAVEAAGGAGDPVALSARLYELLVARGRLRDTYPDFVRDVMVATIPNPGVWVDGAVTESEDATVVMRRPSAEPGAAGEQIERFTEPKDRGLERRFAVTLPPLTARFFSVLAGPLKTLRDAELKLTAGGAPSDRGCYLTLRTGHVVHSEPRRLGRAGVALPALGRDFSGIWVAVFNPDPESPGEVELTVAVRPQSSPLARRSPFSALGRKPR
ncbi:MAG: hypothetical protein HY614_04650 [Candidatus Rokubacteria bacterium]|nr:hypothetical protein [Candidatus Rokubacteria bacterium]